MKLLNILIYTDGSSRGNPGPGGWGAIIATKEMVTEIGEGDKHTTNNKMELTSAIKSLEFVRDLGSAFTIDMRADSRYVINGITKWVFGWQKNGWVNSQKKDVLNRELWENLAEVTADLQMSGSKILWNYTPGHSGIPGNERADEIATTFADRVSPNLFKGSRSKYSLDLTSHAGDQKLPAIKKSKSKEKAYSYISLVNGKCMKHDTWVECERRVKGVPNVKFKKTRSADDERQTMFLWKSNR
ncbi:MAG: ribonuclease HI [Candidatus Yonathbacteria bacterium]|nr:ribonuclease HI [Candidatus Yonathbacteria bacterium]